MKLKYRSFINKNGEGMQTITNALARQLSKGNDIHPQYKNCQVSLAEARIVEQNEVRPSLQSVHVWSLFFNAEGKLTERKLKRFSATDLSKREEALNKTNDILASYVHETFNLDHAENTIHSDNTLYSQLWTLAAA